MENTKKEYAIKVESIKNSSSMSKSNPNSTLVFSPVLQSLSWDWDMNVEKSELTRMIGKKIINMLNLIFNSTLYNFADIQKE